MQLGSNLASYSHNNTLVKGGVRLYITKQYITKQLDDGWPESVEEQGLLLLVWRCNFRNGI